MMTADVTGKPLNIIGDLYDFEINASALSNSAYQQTSVPLITALPLLPSALQAQLAPLTPYLTPTIGALFNTAWQSAQSTEETQAAATFTTQAKNAGTGVSNVSCTLASSGNVRAVTTPAASAAQPATLSLIYGLPGGDFHFYYGPLSAGWKIDFDAALSVSTPVPVTPFALFPSVNAALYNALGTVTATGGGVSASLNPPINLLGEPK